MKFSDFSNIILGQVAPVILIEGRRSISPDLAKSAREVASFLAVRFPHLSFRSGNANGSDEAFSAGVLDVSSARLQVIAPYASHRARQRHPLVRYDSPESLDPDALEQIKAMTIAATPGNKGLVNCYEKGGRLGAQAACLIRDTMKVGGESAGLGKPLAEVFCIDSATPEADGTGHTIRTCRNSGVPVIFQDSWQSWFKELPTLPI
jgi:hypothetical protein